MPGAAIAFEKHILARVWNHIHRGLEVAFGVAPDEAPAAAAPAPAASRDCLDEDGLDERKAYTAKVGTWRQRSLDITRSSRFYLIIRCVHKVHAVMDHLLNDLKKTDYPEGQFLAFLFRGRREFCNLFVALMDHTARVLRFGRTHITNP